MLSWCCDPGGSCWRFTSTRELGMVSVGEWHGVRSPRELMLYGGVLMVWCECDMVWLEAACLNARRRRRLGVAVV
uniref:Uncharacterized protein n=1 Tax=Setaria viridis TaxID=4556 RepID=A0A4U6TJ06_SETVI|nr:hypothetical protein SEVIR_8G145250v2 [Setaria viridis]